MLCDNLGVGVAGEAGGRLKREGIYVCMWLIPTVVQQKITQHYKAIILHAPPPPPKKKNTEEIQSSRVYKVYPFALEQAQALSHLEIGGGKKAKERLCFWVCEPNSQQNNSTLPPIVLSYSQKLWPLSANAGNNHVLYTSRNSNRNTTKSLFFLSGGLGRLFPEMQKEKSMTLSMESMGATPNFFFIRRSTWLSYIELLSW